jgi:hypothetical protein
MSLDQLHGGGAGSGVWWRRSLDKLEDRKNRVVTSGVYQVETTKPVQTMQTIIRITGSKSDDYGERWDNFTQTRLPAPTSFVTFAKNPCPLQPDAPHRFEEATP